MMRNELGTTSIGLRLMGIAALGLLIVIILSVLIATNKVPLTLVEPLGYATIAIPIAFLVGLAMCLSCPGRFAAKGSLIASVCLFVVAILAEAFPLEVLKLFGGYGRLIPTVCDLAGMASLLVWTRSLAKAVGVPKQAKRADSLLLTGIILVAIPIVIIALARFAPDLVVQQKTGLGLVILGLIICSLIWIGGFASLMLGVGSAAGRYAPTVLPQDLLPEE